MGAYDVDFHHWLLAQADAIRRRSMNEIDWENLAEEVEALGRSEPRSLVSHLTLLCQHLLKWEHQPERRGRSWMKTVREQRMMIPSILEDSPSLKPTMQENFLKAYARARYAAADEMDIDEADLPEAPPFTLEQALEIRYPPGLATWDVDHEG